MPKHLIAFLSSRSDLTDKQVTEQLPDLSQEAHVLKLTDYRITPLQPMFDDTAQAGCQPPLGDLPEGYELFVKTLQAMKDRYPFRAAVLEFKTILRVLHASCEQQALEKMPAKDYAMLLRLLDEMDHLTEECQKCPISRNPFESSTFTQ